MAQPVDFAQLVHHAAGKRLIAISGFGGAGKSTTATRLTEVLGATVVSQVLEPARAGQEIRYQRYDWPTNQLADWIDLPEQARLVVEGIGLIHPDLKGYFDLSVWVDVPLVVASERGKYRDREIYKVDHDQLWDDLWTPNDRDYFEKYRPDKQADLLLSND